MMFQWPGVRVGAFSMDAWITVGKLDASPAFEEILIFRVGRVAQALQLNFGCPVLRFLKGGGFVVISNGRSTHRVDANQPGFLLRIE